MKKFKTLIAVLLCSVCLILCSCSAVLPALPDVGGVDVPAAEEYVTPVVRINVADNKPIVSKEKYLSASVTLWNEKGEVALDGVDAKVRGRGNFTWTLPKKGYRIKFDKKQKMLSSYECKSWALLPNYTDKTLLRNYYALNMARKMDGLDWATDSKHIEVYLNDEYMGVYLLCDQTQVDKNRVNVEKDSLDADTGFLIERDHYALEDPELIEGRDYFTIEDDYFYNALNPSKSGLIPYVLKSPEYPDKDDYDTDADFDNAVTAYCAQFEYIKNYVTKVFRAVKDADFDTFKKLCDEESFVDYFILDQVTANFEIDRLSSFYFHKDKGGELIAGPAWDYDMSAGYYSTDPKHGLKHSNNWFVSLAEGNAEFRRIYIERLEKHSELFKSEVKKLTDVAQKNKEAFARNNEKWPVDEPVMNMPDAMFELKTYDAHLTFFMDYITERTDYLKEYLSDWH